MSSGERESIPYGRQNCIQECDGIQAAVKASLNLYEIFHNGGDLASWRKENRKSLCSGFHDADASAIIAWNKRMQELVQMDEIDARLPIES